MMQTMNASTAKSSVVRSTRLGAAPRVALPARRSVIRRFKEDVSEASTSEKVKVSFKFPHHVDFGENICVVGAHDSLGSWDVGSSVPLNWNEGDVWTAELELPLDGAVEYKYVIRAEHNTRWMPCDNLVLEVPTSIAQVSIEDNWFGTTHDIIIPGAQPAEQVQEPAKEQEAAEQEVPKAEAPKAEAIKAEVKAEVKAEPAVESVKPIAAAVKPIEKLIEKVTGKAAATTEASTKPAASQAAEAKVVSETAAAVKEAVVAGASAAAKDSAKTRKPTSSGSGNGNGNGSAAKGGLSKLFK